MGVGSDSGGRGVGWDRVAGSLAAGPIGWRSIGVLVLPFVRPLLEPEEEERLPSGVTRPYAAAEKIIQRAGAAHAAAEREWASPTDRCLSPTPEPGGLALLTLGALPLLRRRRS